MPGSPRLGNRRVTPLREIGLRMIKRPAPGHFATTDPAPGAIQWASCAPQAIKPQKPVTAAKQPTYIFLSAVTVVMLPQFTKFTNPCE